MRNPLKNAIQSLLYNRGHLMAAILKRVPWIIKDDARYLKYMVKFETGRQLNLVQPETFCDKIQWLKLYNHRSEYTTMVDKYAVKQYVTNTIGAEYIIPILGEWNSPNEIEWEKLPQQFVIKTNHDGGGHGIVVCKNKETFDRSKAMKELLHSFGRSSYMVGREWPYKNVKKLIFAEQYIEDKSGELRDYKFFCFNGEVKCFKVDFNRMINHQANYYDRKCQLLNYGESAYPPRYDANIAIPTNINKMIELAEKLAKDQPFIRVDFYNVDGRIYFGEITFFPAGGLTRWCGDVDVDKLWGSWITLPKEKII